MEIHSIPMGPFTNCFVVKGSHGALLIDTGFPNQEKRFHRAIQRLGIRPADIQLILATHGHADHVGSLKALKNRTSAKAVIHRKDSHLLQDGVVMIPPAVNAWGRLLFLAFKTLRFLGRFEPVEPEIVIEETFSLEPFGFQGTIIPTPGHTPGSVSVILRSGEAFVGDTAVNSFPLMLGLGIPALAENLADIYVSWRRILSVGATTIYPAHGKPFPAEQLAKKMPRHIVEDRDR
jgi:hydroxyacylglutathione hydrolase